MAQASLPPNLKTALFAAGGGFVGAAVGVLAVNAMTDSDPENSAAHDSESSRPAMVAELQPSSD